MMVKEMAPHMDYGVWGYGDWVMGTGLWGLGYGDWDYVETGIVRTGVYGGGMPSRWSTPTPSACRRTLHVV